MTVLPKDARIGAYKIERVLGEGGMGFVYEATHEVLNRRTAIKMLRPELAVHEQIVTRFLNEAKAVNLIDHQNIVNVYDYGDSLAGSVYFVMEYLEGETLDDLMRKRQPMALPLLLHVFGQMGKALVAAHAKQIVHRDLKPANVFVIAREDNPYFIKLLDFGIAQLRGAGAVQGLTMVGSVMGTPQYMSPEQITGGIVDARSDVWAMGVMMYRAATGHAPFKGEELGELTEKILRHVPVPADQLAPVPPALSALIASCLERNPDARCPSITALLNGLERLKQQCKLDDDAILAAVRADSGAINELLPARKRDATRDSLIGSLPEYQVDPRLELRPSASAARPRSRLAMYMTVAALAGALGSAAYVVVGRGKHVEVSPEPPVQTDKTPKPPEPPPRQVKGLRDTIAEGTLQQQAFAVDGLALLRAPAAAPLLYAALKKGPDVRVRAARALGALGLPDAAPKLRAALAESGERIKVELAAPLFILHDNDARAILVRALEDPATRLVAAAALAEAGDAAGRAVLVDIVAADSPGSERWRRATGALVKLGDPGARKALEGELARPEAARSVGAAELLARAGDASAREHLARVLADPEFSQRGQAAAALARLGDKRALGWVDEGLASKAAEDRKLALAICGALAADAVTHTRAISTLATDDPDLSVRMAAEAVLLGL